MEHQSHVAMFGGHDLEMMDEKKVFSSNLIGVI